MNTQVVSLKNRTRSRTTPPVRHRFVQWALALFITLIMLRLPLALLLQ